MFKCYNRVPCAFNNTENMEKNNPELFLRSLSLQACEKMCFPRVIARDLIIILTPFSCVFASDIGVPVLMPWLKFEQNMLTVLSLAAQTSTENRALIDLFTVYYAAATQIFQV